MAEGLPTTAVFDLDDTLYSYPPCHEAGIEAVRALIETETDLDASRFSDAWNQARLMVKRQLGPVAASHSRMLYANQAFALLGAGAQPSLSLAVEHEYWREFLSAMRLRPHARELLEELRYHGATTAVVTDLTLQIQLRKLVHLDVDGLVDHVVASEEAGVNKVGLEPFRLLFSRVDPSRVERVWFVGDSAHDVTCVDPLVSEGWIESGTGWLLDRGPSEPGRAHLWSGLDEVLAALRTAAQVERHGRRPLLA